LRHRIETVNDVRAAMLGGKYFRGHLMALERELQKLTVGKAEMIKRNWAELKVTGRS